MVAAESAYSRDQLIALYELGRMYYEMGYFTPAERIFNGIAILDEQAAPARLALGLLKLERGLHAEAATHFRSVLQHDAYAFQAKLGLCLSFLRAGERSRARSVLAEIVKSSGGVEATEPEVGTLFGALTEMFDAEEN